MSTVASNRITPSARRDVAGVNDTAALVGRVLLAALFTWLRNLTPAPPVATAPTACIAQAPRDAKRDPAHSCDRAVH